MSLKENLDYFTENRETGETVANIEGVSDTIHGLAYYMATNPVPTGEIERAGHYIAIAKNLEEAIVAGLDGFKDDLETKLEAEA